MNCRKFLFVLFAFTSISAFSQKTNVLQDSAQKALNSKKYENAVRLFTKLITATPDYYQYYEHRAFCYHQLGEYPKAITDCNKAISLFPDQKQLFYIRNLRGVCFIELEEWSKALEDIDIASKYYSDDISLTRIKAYILYKSGRYSDAITGYQSVLNSKAVNTNEKIRAYSGLGYCYYRMDSIVKAKDYLKRVKELDSLSIDGLYLQGVMNWRVDNNEAIWCYTRIISIDSSESRAYYNRGVTYNLERKYDLAIADFQKCLNKSYDGDPALYHIGKSYRGIKKYEKAIHSFTLCLKYEPNSSRIYNQISWTYFLTKNYNQGLVYADKAILADVKNEDAYDTRGSIYYKLGKYEQAIKDFDMALGIDSSYSNSHYFRAICYLKTKESEKACNDLRILVKDEGYEILPNEKTVGVLIKENCTSLSGAGGN